MSDERSAFAPYAVSGCARQAVSRGAAAVVVAAALICAGAPSRAAAAFEGYLAPPAACPGSDVPTLLRGDQEGSMLCMIDYARRVAGVGALARSPLLGWSAAIKADDIVRCGDFSHTACGRPADAPFEQAGYVAAGFATEVTENLATGSDLLGTPRSIMSDWLEDEPHRTAMLDPRWRDQGVSQRKPPALLGLTDSAVWVSHFGYRAPVVMTSLKVSVGPKATTERRKTSFRFSVTAVTGGVRSRVDGAIVKFAGRRTRTDASGRATITASIQRPGTFRALAAKGALRAKVAIRVARRRKG